MMSSLNAHWCAPHVGSCGLALPGYHNLHHLHHVPFSSSSSFKSCFFLALAAYHNLHHPHHVSADGLGVVLEDFRNSLPFLKPVCAMNTFDSQTIGYISGLSNTISIPSLSSIGPPPPILHYYCVCRVFNGFLLKMSRIDITNIEPLIT